MLQRAYFTGIVTIALVSTANASVIFAPIFDPPTTAGGGTSTRSGPGTWQLFAVDDSDADFGISGYNITYGPAVTAINHRTPNGIATDGNGDDQSAGFGLLRSGTNINPMVASQGLPGTTPFLITGFGQTPGTLAAKVAAIDPAATVTPTSSANWGTYTRPELNTHLPQVWANGNSWMLMAEGRYSGLRPTLSQFIVSTVATVYTNSQTFTSTTVSTQVIDACLGCFPPDLQDDVVSNVDANNPGLISRFFKNVGGSAGFSIQFDSYVPAPGMPGTGPAIPAYVDPPTQKFTWNTVGSPIGTYKWLVTGTNNYGSDQASLTINITVPEPSAAILFLLASLAPFGAIGNRVRHGNSA